MRVVGYVRVSTAEQADSGAGMESQRQAISSEAARRGWEIFCIHEDAGASGKSVSGRPGLATALGAMSAGEADALVVAKLDRLSRSLLDFAGLMERARREGWGIVALDLGVDTSTPAGEMLASVLATFAQFERRLIGQRTRDALAIKREQGVKLGRPREVGDEARSRILDLHAQGLQVAQIARRLNEEGIATPRGGTWYSPGVKRVLGWGTS